MQNDAVLVVEALGENQLTSWSAVKKLKTVDYDWESWSQSSGIYIVSYGQSVNRIFGCDEAGILYIGKAKNLRDRVHQFYRSDHNVSWFLYNHRDIARKYMSKEIKDFDDEKEMAPYVGELNIRYAEAESESQAEYLERVAIFSYLKLFGEVPPLNSSIPNRYDKPPTQNEMEWFIRESKVAI